jgi:osmotically-inducible protein OsmY
MIWTIKHIRRIKYSGLMVGFLSLAFLSGCVPIVAGTALTVGTLSMTDRRTVGMQIEDKQIQSKISDRIVIAYGDSAHVNVTSFNRMVLLTGEVMDEKTKKDIGKIASSVENVVTVVNELGLTINSSLSARAKDSLITTKVKATFVDDSMIHANAFKVVTERGEVFLMGRVTKEEAEAASDLASRVSDVKKVVKVFEYITKEDLEKMNSQPAETNKQSKAETDKKS